MTRTHRGASGDDAGGSGARGNGNKDLPPPPHPTPVEIMAQLIETQRSMGDVLRNLAQNGGHGRGRDQHQDLNLTSLALLRTFLTPSLLPLRKQRSHCRQMNG